jgi:hypothetical protein
MSFPLTPFLNSRGVVVVGDSTSLEKLGYGAVRRANNDLQDALAAFDED